MRRFELILNCKVEGVQKIIEYVKKEIKEDFRIITDNDSVRDEFVNRGIHAMTILDIIPTDSIEEVGIYEKVAEDIKLLRDIFSNVRDEDVEIFNAFRNTIHDLLISIEKIHLILNSTKKSHVILCLSHYYFYEIASLNIASSLGYLSTLPLTIKGNNLVTVDPFSIIGQKHAYKIIYHDKLSINKKNIGKEQSNLSTYIRNFWKITKRVVKNDDNVLQELKKRNIGSVTNTIKNAIQHDPGKFINSNKDKPESKLLEKLSQFKFSKKPCLLLLHTNPADLYLKPVYPLIEEFEKNQYPYFILANDIRAQKALSEKNIGFMNYEPYLNDFGYNSEIVQKMINVIKSIAIQNDSVLSSLFQYLLNDVFLVELINHLKSIRLFSVLISQLNPISIFVMPDTIDNQMLMVDVAKKYKIKTVTTLASLIAPTPRSVVYRSADIITTYGEDCNVSLTKMGYDKSRLIMTGNPRYDYIKKLDISSIQSNLHKKLGINFDRPVILVATSSVFHTTEIKWMIEAIRFANHKNYDIIIKIHPAADLEYYKDHLELIKSHKFYLIHKEFEITELVSIASTVITDYSSSGVSAILLDKPLIVVNLTGHPYADNRYDEYGVALLVKTIKDLEYSVYRTITDKQTQNTLSDAIKKYQYWYNYKNDGKAASRLFDVLISQNLRKDHILT